MCIRDRLDTWKQKAETAENDYKQKIYDRDFSDALKTEMESIKFSSEAAKKAVMTEIKESGLKLKDGKILGLSDLIGQIKEREDVYKRQFWGCIVHRSCQRRYKRCVGSRNES